MRNFERGRYSLPRELHRYVLEQPQDPLPPDLSSDAGSSQVQARTSFQRYSYPPTPNPALSTSATHPSDDDGDRPLSPYDSEMTDMDDHEESSSQNASATSHSREPVGDDPSLTRASSIHHGVQPTSWNQTEHEIDFNRLVHHSYTYPPPAPPPYGPLGPSGRPIGEMHVSSWQSQGTEEQEHRRRGQGGLLEKYEDRHDLMAPNRPLEYATTTRYNPDLIHI